LNVTASREGGYQQIEPVKLKQSRSGRSSHSNPEDFEFFQDAWSLVQAIGIAQQIESPKSTQS
jgi:hypothetical protein